MQWLRGSRKPRLAVACCFPLRLPACAAAHGHTCCPTSVNRRPDCAPLAALRRELHRLRSQCISSRSVHIRELTPAQMRLPSLCAGKFVEDIAHRAQRREQQQPSADELGILHMPSLLIRHTCAHHVSSVTCHVSSDTHCASYSVCFVLSVHAVPSPS